MIRISEARTALALCAILVLMVVPSDSVFGAAVETPTGKLIPGRILEEAGDVYKVGTKLPGGGRIIFNVDREKVDPHGLVPGKGRIQDIKGKAEIRKARMTWFKPAAKYMTVNAGDEIRTGPDSEVVLTLESSAVNGVKANTSFGLKHFEVNPETEAAQIKIDLPKGKLWSEVGRLKTKDSSFEIETPTVVTGVRGTVFLVEVEEETADSSIAVLSGKVAVGIKDVVAPEIILDKREAIVAKRGQEPRKFAPAELARIIVEIAKDWMQQSQYFQTVTALAGIGEIEAIEVEPGVPETERQLIYDRIQAGWAKASEDFFQIDKAMKMFYLDFGRFPTSEEGGLNALVSSTGLPQWNGPYMEKEYLLDHYGVPYAYAVLYDMDGYPYALITTYGYDETPGTQDDRKRIILEKDARRWEDGRSYR